MSRRRTERLLVTRISGSGSDVDARRRPDDVIVEEPMSIELDGTRVCTTMRTPGHDYELAAGFCFTEGLLGGASIGGVRYCAGGSALESEYNVVTVDTGGRAPSPSPRLGIVSSSCGWCGSEHLDELCAVMTPLVSSQPFDLAVIRGIPETVRSGQGLFDATGAVHAAAAFDQRGEVLVVREDVGRHNAVDKVVGAMLLADVAPIPATDLGLFVSGRASIEMVQKAWAAGFTALLAVSAPTALAVHAARRSAMTLAGFVRGDELNIYSPERVTAPPQP
jgi:FdhD protein